jgi:hypothetical protein
MGTCRECSNWHEEFKLARNDVNEILAPCNSVHLTEIRFRLTACLCNYIGNGTVTPVFYTTGDGACDYFEKKDDISTSVAPDEEDK